MACTHNRTIRYNDVKVCLQCGMTFIPGKSPFFDKTIVNYCSTKKGKKKHGGKKN